MEDVKAYIESGILELYVLGDLSTEERKQVEAMAGQHSAVRTELDNIARTMEQYAAEHAIEPSENLRNRVLNNLVTNLGDDRIFTKGKYRDEDHVAILPSQKTSQFFKYAFAACLALLVLSVAALVTVYNRLQDSNQQLLAMQSQNQQYSTRVNLLDNEIQVFRDPSFKLIQLLGTVKAPLSKLTVAWSPVRKKVMIDMANMKLPATDPKHQYQLWAIVNNKPVDLGVFNAGSDTTDMKLMKPIAQAEAFAVTLEPKGGSTFPTLDQMIVQAKM